MKKWEINADCQIRKKKKKVNVVGLCGGYDSILLKEAILGIQESGFKIFLHEYDPLESPEFSIYWRSYWVTSFRWTGYVFYGSSSHFRLNQYYMNDLSLLRGVLDYFHRGPSLSILLMARITKDIKCYLGKLPSDLINYIYEYVIG